MTGLVRPHFLSSGDALDRRRVQELFLYAANLLNELSGTGIKNAQFTRTNFNMDTWEEYQSDYDTNMRFITPEMGYALPAAALDVQCDDSFFDGMLSWSIAVEVGSALASNMVMAIPTLCGIPLYGGEDWQEVDQLISYTLGDPADPAINPDEIEGDDASSMDASYGLSLGNSVGFTGLNGRGRAGILIYSLGKFKVKACSITCRKVLR
jgi:hypothetical protein